MGREEEQEGRPGHGGASDTEPSALVWGPCSPKSLSIPPDPHGAESHLHLDLLSVLLASLPWVPTGRRRDPGGGAWLLVTPGSWQVSVAQ